MTMKILFVCTDNNGRSVVAEYSLRRYLVNKEITGVEVSSCGTNANSDLNGFSFAHLDVLKKLGMDASDHKRTQLTEGMIVNADWVIVFDHKQQKYLKANFGCDAELFDHICFARDTEVTFSGFGKSKDENAVALAHHINDAIPVFYQIVIAKENLNNILLSCTR